MTTGAVNQYEITNQYADDTSNTLVIKKELDGEALAGNTAPFTFEVILSDKSFNGDIYYKDTDKVIGTFENGSGTFQIDAGEYATIKGLHAGTSASVKEEEMPYGYEVKTLTVTRKDSTGKETEIAQVDKNVRFGLAEVGTIELGTNTYTVTFVNTKSETEKPNTVVIKKVLDNATSSSSNTKFTFMANIEGFTGDAYIDGTKTVAGTFDEKGYGTITLAAGQSVTFTGLEPLARFGVMESEIPSNYSFVSVAATIQHGDEATEELKSLDGDEDAAQMMMRGGFAQDTDNNTVTITFTNHADKTTTETPTTPTPTTTETPDEPDETEETGEPTPLSTETTETDESSMDNADDQEDKSTMSNQNSVPADADATETLPQTGMNWFPIVILLAAGLALILAGAAAHNRRKSGT
jgi:LPXTG-motif cell wall-anchored protein